jgi:glycosyltransferase involved in cell wall biosynthesis
MTSTSNEKYNKEVTRSDIETRCSYHGVSVIVCCYNSEEVIERTLIALANQTVSAEINWEILLIDNNCSDNTVSIATRVIQAHDLACRFRVIPERSPGLSPARIRGATESRYSIIAFVDDDNVCAPTWVQTAYETLSAHPKIGALGGRIVADFNAITSTWANRSPNLLGCETGPPATSKVAYCSFIIGAGMILRKVAFLTAFASQDTNQFILDDRKGDVQSGGGDIELCLRLRKRGWQIGFNPKLYLTHNIPPDRTTHQYLKRLVYGAAESEVFIYRMRCHVERHLGKARNTTYAWMLLRQAGLVALNLKRLTFPKGDRMVALISLNASLGTLIRLLKSRQDVQAVMIRIDNEFAALSERSSAD